ncbi:TrbI/VirB10 family protein [Phenylobacterium sp.]|uniref:TrbI/VirB10 family protein n=1 Tax=Phenylobacterium sp. TaxID=1871053 RepID=UPI0025D39F9E|nr:TrbI/VirB10 family protein [Phenylobacterium sp.]
MAKDAELSVRAARPAVARLRKGAALALVLTGAALVAGALVWSFVLAPHLKARAQSAITEAPHDGSKRQARPAEIITSQPASYDRLADLPPPRALGNAPEPSSAEDAAPRSRPPPAPTPDRAPQRSELLFARPSAGAIAPQQSAAVPPAATNLPAGLVAPLSPYELKAGSIIPASLLNAIDTARPGPVIALVSANVFDTVSAKHLLAPQGSRLVGRQDGASRYGERRAFIVWERLILPNGKSVALIGAAGVDAQGAAGVVGRADRRLGQMGLGVLLAGAITALGEMARGHDRDDGGWATSAADAAAIEAAQVGGRLIDREMQVTPSIRLEAGAPVRALLTHDLVLEPYVP